MKSFGLWKSALSLIDLSRAWERSTCAFPKRKERHTYFDNRVQRTFKNIHVSLQVLDPSQEGSDKWTRPSWIFHQGSDRSHGA